MDVKYFRQEEQTKIIHFNSYGFYYGTVFLLDLLNETRDHSLNLS